jgi:signal transduction histidine kinase
MQATRSGTRSRARATPSVASDGPPRVLVVDDDENNLLAISTVLEDLGEIVVAKSGEEALRQLLRGEFAVILLDVYMPGLDGYETAQIIREREQTKGIPIVFLSAVNKETQHLIRGYSMGAVDYVFKPVEPVVLRSKVAVFVDLFAKSREIERKARQEQALLDENLRANAERLKAEQDLRHAEAQLFHVQKMDAIGKLTGGIAHDFNNLLAAVIGGLRLIERRADLPAQAQEVLDMTKRAAEQGTELVRRLLAFARRQQLQPTAIELNALAKSVTGLLGPTLGGRHQLDWRVGQSLWHAFADPAQLELALMNLILNARDSMADGGTIQVTAENRTVAGGKDGGLDKGEYVVLTVVDSGCGIPSEMIEKVMEPFVTTKDIGKGTGLGLSMVYGFARQSNGVFRLDSELGKGTRAELWLPRSTAPASDRKAPPPRVPAKAERPLRVLLVDDHDEVRAATLGMLEDLGHSVVDAANGPEALDLLDGKLAEWDLLITDYAMPHTSGTQLVEQARKLRPDLPSLIITGYADSEAIGERPDDVAILGKPFSLEQLAHMIAVVRPSDASAAEVGLPVG